MKVIADTTLERLAMKGNAKDDEIALWSEYATQTVTPSVTVNNKGSAGSYSDNNGLQISDNQNIAANVTHEKDTLYYVKLVSFLIDKKINLSMIYNFYRFA